MILGLDDLKKVAVGTEEIVESEKGFEFLRFNKNEQELYKESPLYKRTYTPAGIELMFKTDAEIITISLETEKCADRSFFCIDVLKNNEIVGSIKNFDEDKMIGFYSWTEYPLGEFFETIELGQGDKEIKIVLPWSVRCFFKKFELKNATYTEAFQHKNNILMYGDSITHGYDSIHPSNSYAMRLAK